MGFLKYYLKGSSGDGVIMEDYYGDYGGLLWLGAAATHNNISHNCYIALLTITFYTPITELLYRKYKESPTIKPGKLLLIVHNISYS